VINKNCQPSICSGREPGYCCNEIVDSTHRLYHNAQFPQLVTPDAFKKSGIMISLYPEPRSLSNSRHLLSRNHSPSGGAPRGRL
jgi:hypothetical protein